VDRLGTYFTNWAGRYGEVFVSSGLFCGWFMTLPKV
jgi:hypothetical protein